MSAPPAPPPVKPAPQEDPIECEAVRRHGCAFWRGDWHASGGGREVRITAREFGYGGPGYCFFEMRCARTRNRTTRQDWYLNWRNFTPAPGMRLIADYRPRQEICT
ncbi:hypothetical protein [Anderseniella sp. Alg231-50]|uniref:hypothetical protein n=1 Tax=Anderseniella sp. Alg231-50 TaxID=1922226 RepID=UPI00307BAA4E